MGNGGEVLSEEEEDGVDDDLLTWGEDGLAVTDPLAAEMGERAREAERSAGEETVVAARRSAAVVGSSGENNNVDSRSIEVSRSTNGKSFLEEQESAAAPGGHDESFSPEVDHLIPDVEGRFHDVKSPLAYEPSFYGEDAPTSFLGAPFVPVGDADDISAAAVNASENRTRKPADAKQNVLVEPLTKEELEFRRTEAQGYLTLHANETYPYPSDLGCFKIALPPGPVWGQTMLLLVHLQLNCPQVNSFINRPGGFLASFHPEAGE